MPQIRRYDTAVAVMLVTLAALHVAPAAGQAPGGERIVDFSSAAAPEWYPVNDGVMGGRSSSTMRLAEGIGVFEGNLSLENNGGFASVRTEIPEAALSGFSRLLLRVRGDGKRYQLRLRMSTTFDGVAYGASFETQEADWTTVEIPLESFAPSFRGYRPRNAPELDFANVRQIGLMLTDKQEGRFRLEIAWIAADAGDAGR